MKIASKITMITEKEPRKSITKRATMVRRKLLLKDRNDPRSIFDRHILKNAKLVIHNESKNDLTKFLHKL